MFERPLSRNVQQNPLEQTSATKAAAVRAAEDRFTKLFNASFDALIICRQEDGSIVEVNESFERLLGYRSTEVSGHTLTDLNFYADPTNLERIPVQLTDQGYIRELEVEIYTKAGDVRQVSLTIETVTSHDQPCWLILLRDITGYKQTAEALYLSENRQRSLVEIMPAAVFTCDKEGLITYFNQRAAELWGRRPKLKDPEDKFCGSFRIYRPDGSLLPHYECPMAIAVLTGRGTRNEEIHILRPDGSVILASVNIDPLFDQAGRLIGAINVFEDITRRKQAEEALRQAHEELEQRVEERTKELELRNNELDQFAYVAAHDLRAPLRAIESLATWIADDCYDLLPSKSKEHLAKLNKRVQRMEHLLGDMLAYARATRQRSAPTEVSVPELVQNVLNLMALPSGFHVTVVSGMPSFVTESVPLELVLRNLLNNALKHHHQPHLGRVHVSAQEHDNHVEFAVGDNGPGIAPQFHERIFQIFQTLKPRDEVEGSGMGLAIVKKIVENRGGRIWLESTVGEGTTFYFVWPKTSERQNTPRLPDVFG